MNPENTALLLIGFQNDYFARDGILNNVIEESASAKNTVDNTVKLIQNLAKTPVLIISTPVFFTPDYKELIDPVGILAMVKQAGAFQAGGKGSQTIEQLQPFHGKILEIPGKRGLNAFANTNLHDVLQQKNIKHLVLAGAVTSVCIDSTGRSAYEQGYRVSILNDCTSARTRFEQDFYFENVFSLYAQTLTSVELLERLEPIAV
ncbi:MAG: cysteine hydrolase family protein [Cyanobacteria bacterium SBLK]|nr:cysteine hydrolase family protein [Cyanobacteria bacterium SBLK]